MKNYKNKRKRTVTDQETTASSNEADETPTKKSRYPSRKRKEMARDDDSHVVSDDAVSETSFDAIAPMKKKARITRSKC